MFNGQNLNIQVTRIRLQDMIVLILAFLVVIVGVI